jgi:lincosamide and streptogramin A transport system ATP-binding/permease protein
MSLVSVSNLTFGYDGSLNNVFEDVSFNIDTDWKLGLIRKKWKRKNYFFKIIIR